MLTEEDKQWLSKNLVTKDALKSELSAFATKLRAEIAQLRVDLMDEMARVYRDLDHRITTTEDKLEIKR